MGSHGRGRGMRRALEAGQGGGTGERPGGLKAGAGRAREEEEGRGGAGRNTEDCSPVPDTTSLTDLLDLVDRLDGEGKEEKRTEQVRRITKCMKHLCSTEESLRSVVDEMHRLALGSEEAGRKAARAFGVVSQLEVGGTKLRDVVLRCIQTDFKRKDEILAEGEPGFLAAVSLLCEVFHHLRLADGTVINVLAVPILEYCDLLLSQPTEPAVSLLGRQLQVIGEEVQRSRPEKFAELMLRVRGLVVGEGGPGGGTRAVLLHLLECHLLRWPTHLPDKTGDWYRGLLGERVLRRGSSSLVQSSSSAAQPATRPASNGHRPSKEEGLTAEDELVLQRVLGAGQSPPYYDAGPRLQFTTPPPALPGYTTPRPAAPPPRHHQPDPRLNGAERLAVDLMAMGLPGAGAGVPPYQAAPPPSQVSPLGANRPPPPRAAAPPPAGGWDRPRSHPGPGWSAMPPHSAGPPGPRAGSGRIVSQDPPGGTGQWGGGGQQRPGPGSFGREPAGRESGFDIGTWEDPGAGADRRTSKPGGSWSSGDDSSSGRGWSNGGGEAGGGWSSGAEPGPAWSTSDGKEESGPGIGTWENPRKQAPGLKPLRNEEVRSWGEGGAGAAGWGASQDAVTPTKDWSHNSSTGSVEISPGSAWKKEPSVVGNWADELQSPRTAESDSDNPLDASLKEARKSLSNW